MLHCDFGPCSPQGLEGNVQLTDCTSAIAEDAEAEGATEILRDEDMAPARKEQAFVTRLIRQNSVKQRR